MAAAEASRRLLIVATSAVATTRADAFDYTARAPAVQRRAAKIADVDR